MILKQPIKHRTFASWLMNFDLFVQLWLLKRKECDAYVGSHLGWGGGALGVGVLSAFMLYYGTLLITTTS
jgi:hypothetical protein